MVGKGGAVSQFRLLAMEQFPAIARWPARTSAGSRFIDLEESPLPAPIRTGKTPQVREIEALVGLDHLNDVFGLIKEKHIRRPVSR